MKRLLIAIAAGGAGAGAFFLFTREALASEDETGRTLTPAETKTEAAKIAPGAASSLGAKAVEVGLRYVGTKEEPKGSNRGPVVDQINRGVRGDGAKLLGQPWCARFVRFCFEKAAEEAGRPAPFAGVKGTLAAVTSWRDAFKGYEIAEPKAGAAALMIKPSLSGVDKGHRHAALVMRLDGNKVVTVEGNHSDQVAVVTRPRSDFTTFIDVDRYIADKSRPAVSGAGALLGLDVFCSS